MVIIVLMFITKLVKHQLFQFAMGWKNFKIDKAIVLMYVYSFRTNLTKLLFP